MMRVFSFILLLSSCILLVSSSCGNGCLDDVQISTLTDSTWIQYSFSFDDKRRNGGSDSCDVSNFSILIPACAGDFLDVTNATTQDTGINPCSIIYGSGYANYTKFQFRSGYQSANISFSNPVIFGQGNIFLKGAGRTSSCSKCTTTVPVGCPTTSSSSTVAPTTTSSSSVQSTIAPTTTSSVARTTVPTEPEFVCCWNQQCFITDPDFCRAIGGTFVLGPCSALPCAFTSSSAIPSTTTTTSVTPPSSSNPPPSSSTQRTGACCDDQNECHVISETDCNVFAGTTFFPEKMCNDTVSCCNYTIPQCIETTIAACCNDSNSNFTDSCGVKTVDPCGFPTTTSSNVPTTSTSSVARTTSSSTSTDPADEGACCLPDGGCVQTRVTRCRGPLGGIAFPTKDCQDYIPCCNSTTSKCERASIAQCCADPESHFVRTCDQCVFTTTTTTSTPSTTTTITTTTTDPADEGACCLPDGRCIQGPVDRCRGAGGTAFPLWDCDHNISCCNPASRVCAFTSIRRCCNDPNSHFVRTCDSCVFSTSSITSTSTSTSIPTTTTTTTTTDPTDEGACCLPDGRCIQGPVDRCRGAGGIAFPAKDCYDNVSCCNPASRVCAITSIGRCCADSNSHFVRTCKDCVFTTSSTTTSTPPTTTTTDPADEGACCLPDGRCIQGPVDRCRGAGGTAFPTKDCYDNVTCCNPASRVCAITSIGRCCADSNSHFVRTCDACVFSTSTPATTSSSTTDPTDEGACCLPDGRCLHGSVERCVEARGIVFPTKDCYDNVSCCNPASRVCAITSIGRCCGDSNSHFVQNCDSCVFSTTSSTTSIASTSTTTTVEEPLGACCYLCGPRDVDPFCEVEPEANCTRRSPPGVWHVNKTCAEPLENCSQCEFQRFRHECVAGKCWDAAGNENATCEWNVEVCECVPFPSTTITTTSTTTFEEPLGACCYLCGPRDVDPFCEVENQTKCEGRTPPGVWHVGQTCADPLVNCSQCEDHTRIQDDCPVGQCWNESGFVNGTCRWNDNERQCRCFPATTSSTSITTTTTSITTSTTSITTSTTSITTTSTSTTSRTIEETRTGEIDFGACCYLCGPLDIEPFCEIESNETCLGRTPPGVWHFNMTCDDPLPNCSQCEDPVRVEEECTVGKCWNASGFENGTCRWNPRVGNCSCFSDETTFLTVSGTGEGNITTEASTTTSTTSLTTSTSSSSTSLTTTTSTTSLTSTTTTTTTPEEPLGACCYLCGPFDIEPFCEVENQTKCEGRTPPGVWHFNKTCADPLPNCSQCEYPGRVEEECPVGKCWNASGFENGTCRWNARSENCSCITPTESTTFVTFSGTGGGNVTVETSSTSSSHTTTTSTTSLTTTTSTTSLTTTTTSTTTITTTTTSSTTITTTTTSTSTTTFNTKTISVTCTETAPDIPTTTTTTEEEVGACCSPDSLCHYPVTVFNCRGSQSSWHAGRNCSNPSASMIELCLICGLTSQQVCEGDCYNATGTLKGTCVNVTGTVDCGCVPETTTTTATTTTITTTTTIERRGACCAKRSDAEPATRCECFSNFSESDCLATRGLNPLFEFCDFFPDQDCTPTLCPFVTQPTTTATSTSTSTTTSTPTTGTCCHATVFAPGFNCGSTVSQGVCESLPRINSTFLLGLTCDDTAPCCNFATQTCSTKNIFDCCTDPNSTFTDDCQTADPCGFPSSTADSSSSEPLGACCSTSACRSPEVASNCATSSGENFFVGETCDSSSSDMVTACQLCAVQPTGGCSGACYTSSGVPSQIDSCIGGTECACGFLPVEFGFGNGAGMGGGFMGGTNGSGLTTEEVVAVILISIVVLVFLFALFYMCFFASGALAIARIASRVKKE